MIFPLAGLLGGAVVGAVRARWRDGTGKDIAQWAAVHGLLCGVVGIFVMILVTRGAM